MEIRTIPIGVILLRWTECVGRDNKVIVRTHTYTHTIYQRYSYMPVNVGARCKMNACKQVRNNSTVHVLA